MARKKRKKRTQRAKTEARESASKEKKGEVRILELMSDGERIKLKAKEIISVEVLPLDRPKGIPVENYTFKRNELKLAVPLPIPERIRIKYKA